MQGHSTHNQTSQAEETEYSAWRIKKGNLSGVLPADAGKGRAPELFASFTAKHPGLTHVKT
eukprot:scaffold253768_cov16-Prasinocladus_malaysianus.AAC.1